jgi:hypothetical protein
VGTQIKKSAKKAKAPSTKEKCKCALFLPFAAPPGNPVPEPEATQQQEKQGYIVRYVLK